MRAYGPAEEGARVEHYRILEDVHEREGEHAPAGRRAEPGAVVQGDHVHGLEDEPERQELHRQLDERAVDEGGALVDSDEEDAVDEVAGE